VIELAEGDLGASRNFAAKNLHTDYIAFLDGDDLCGKDWVLASVEHWQSKGLTQAVLHPEYIYYFDESDFNNTPEIAKLKSFWFRHVPSDSYEFDPRVLFWQNIYTSNFFTSREFLVNNPLLKKCVEHGFGIEDWAWNHRTILDGIAHQVVEGTVHMVRTTGKETLNASNLRMGLLPDLDNHWGWMH
jgi:glycosyltransferase involved in cell wall biosynthesis